MNYKFYLEKRLHIELKPSRTSERNYSVSYDRTMPFYETRNELYKRMLRDKKDTVLKQKDSIQGTTVEKIIAKMTGDFEVEFETESKDIGKQSFRIYKTENSIVTEIDSPTMRMEEEMVIKRVKKQNILFAVTESFTDNKYNQRKFYSKFFENPEEANTYYENCKYLTPEKFPYLSIFNKDEIKNDEHLMEVAINSFISGEVKDESLFKHFNKKLFGEKLISKMPEMGLTMVDLRKDIENKKERIEAINKDLEKIIEEKDALGMELDLMKNDEV